MSLQRIKAILLQEFYITIQAVEVIVDNFVFPIMTIVVFGFLSSYLARSNVQVGNNIMLGVLLWEVIFIVQYSVSVGSLWNIWSRNLSNLFIAPLQVKEYLFAQTISGIGKALIILILGSILSFWMFHFNILSVGPFLLMIVTINLIFYAFSFGIIILGLIFRYGTRIQAFAWGLLPLLQPLTAAFYPVSVLPYPLQLVSYLFPPTFCFEAARAGLAGSANTWGLLTLALAENVLYFFIAILFFQLMFRASKDTGQFARNEG